MHVPPFRLTAEPENPLANRTGFAHASPEVGRRHRLGGEAAFLTPSEYPTCSDGKSMTFYGQLDSISDDVCLADAGVLMVFVCFDCFEAEAIVGSS